MVVTIYFFLLVGDWVISTRGSRKVFETFLTKDVYPDEGVLESGIGEEYDTVPFDFFMLKF